MGFHGGGETTREDEIIYGEITGAMIDEATDKIYKHVSDPVQRHEIRTVIEQVVWKVLREVEDNGPW